MSLVHLLWKLAALSIPTGMLIFSVAPATGRLETATVCCPYYLGYDPYFEVSVEAGKWNATFACERCGGRHEVSESRVIPSTPAAGRQLAVQGIRY